MKFSYRHTKVVPLIHLKVEACDEKSVVMVSVPLLGTMAYLSKEGI